MVARHHFSIRRFFEPSISEAFEMIKWKFPPPSFFSYFNRRLSRSRTPDVNNDKMKSGTVRHRGIRGPRASLVDVDVRLARLYRVWDAFFSFHLQTIDAVITGWAPEAEKIFARSQSDNPPPSLPASLTYLASPSPLSPLLPPRLGLCGNYANNERQS